MHKLIEYIKQNRYILLAVTILTFVSLVLSSVTLAYFNLDIKSESTSTMKIEGAEIYAHFANTNFVNITNAAPSNSTPIGSIEFDLEIKNTSSQIPTLYFNLNVLQNDFLDSENDCYLYYVIYEDEAEMDSNTLFERPKSNEIIYVKDISNMEKTTISYRIDFYFPESSSVQNYNKGQDGTLKFMAKIELSSDTSDTSLATTIIEDANYSWADYLMYDETDDHNLRYYGVGADVDIDAVPNFVIFNEEYWRIIGVFNVYNYDTGQYEEAVKIIRANALGADSTYETILDSDGEDYAWDTSDSEDEEKNNGFGINNWSTSVLMEELNGDYLNDTLEDDQYWYNAENNTQDAIFYVNEVIYEEYQEYLVNARWLTGGSDDEYISGLEMYKSERIGYSSLLSFKPYNNQSGVWYGLVGLPYVTDFVYAAAEYYEEQKCSDNIADSIYCAYETNWMTKAMEEWTMTKYISDYNDYVYNWDHSGLYISDTFQRKRVRPVVYLSSNVVVEDGWGTADNPYIIKLNQ